MTKKSPHRIQKNKMTAKSKEEDTDKGKGNEREKEYAGPKK